MNAVIALNPQQMQEAQATTLGWIDRKLAAAEHDLEQADQLHAQLLRTNLRVDHAKALMNSAAKRVSFYEKVKAALAAGYYIIPPFGAALELFAIRTDRKTPDKKRDDYANWHRAQSPRSLPVGAGRYVQRDAVRVESGTVPRPTSSDPNRQVTVYENIEFRDEIDLPVVAMKPQIIEAVGLALEQKIFDALGILPATPQPDPIIAGIINRPGGGSLTFLVAWWLDMRDL